jgi:periplasmic protein TonB
MAGQRTERRYGKLIVGALIAAVLIVGFVSFVRTMMAGKSGKPARQVQTVQLIRPPPPPPPPDQPPPPPQRTDEPLPKDVPEPSPQDQEPPPAQPLGLDAEGSAGGDAFGLAARHGGSDLIGGNGGAVFAWYTNKLKDAVNEKLSADPKLGIRPYSTSAQVWVDREGRIRVKLVTTTGNRETDQRIEQDLQTLLMNDPPPVEMPQPVTMKIARHG